MANYASLDVSNEETAIHVVDDVGTTIWRGKRASDPEVLAAALRRYAPELERVGLETGPLTPWLYHTRKTLGLPVICLDARHARTATALQRNKTMHTMPRRWHSWCASAGTERRESKDGPLISCVTLSVLAPSSSACRLTFRTRSAAR